MTKKRWTLGLLGIGLVLLGYFGLATDALLNWMYPDKIWVHRVNSIEKLETTYTLFSGFELDVVYDKDLGYDVTHPPVPSIGLELEHLLKSQQPFKTYWLDFKNLNATNQQVALERLISISKSLQLAPERLVVESTHPEFLQAFRNYGFKTAFYLPTHMHQESGEVLKASIEDVITKRTAYPTDYISADYRNYELLEQQFPEAEKLFWILSTSDWKSNVIKRLSKYKMASNPKVKQLLVTYDVPVGDR